MANQGSLSEEETEAAMYSNPSKFKTSKQSSNQLVDHNNSRLQHPIDEKLTNNSEEEYNDEEGEDEYDEQDDWYEDEEGKTNNNEKPNVFI